MVSIPKKESVLLKPLSIHITLSMYVHSFFDHFITVGEMIDLLYFILALTTSQPVWYKESLRREEKENVCVYVCVKKILKDLLALWVEAQKFDYDSSSSGKA